MDLADISSMMLKKNSSNMDVIGAENESKKEFDDPKLISIMKYVPDQFTPTEKPK